MGMSDLRWILDDLPIGVWVGRVPGGTTAYANRAFERIAGMAPDPESHIEDVPEAFGLCYRDGNP